MPFKTIIMIAVTTVCLAATTPANASTQDDIQKCRSAFSQHSNINMNDYRLRFERQNGVTTSRARTLYLKAIGLNGQPSFNFSCTLDKNVVMSLNDQTVIQYA